MSSAKHILSLPYDVRYLIYHHLFPPGGQVYIHALQKSMKSILPEQPIPTNLLLVCQQLHQEASEYLYNNHLFNIVGRKKDCLLSYESFATTLRKYARYEVRIDAFSNGNHSATMCISLQAGDAKMRLLQSRGRGELKDIQDLRAECGLDQGSGLADRLLQAIGTAAWQVYLPACAIAVGMLAMLVAHLL